MLPNVLHLCLMMIQPTLSRSGKCSDEFFPPAVLCLHFGVTVYLPQVSQVATHLLHSQEGRMISWAFSTGLTHNLMAK